ncbi:MAG: hypothetical protein J0I99_16375 [Devosia sp.]|nr:hypothetical protein [Devosia sp.]MBN9308143.1 hypothetical protein [Devosia sp.]MBN9317320.1 hypothetical protein [Devosia sp.]
MGDKQVSKDRQVAGEVFRQFAWNLAGTLAKPARRPSRPRPAGGKR